MNSQLALFLCFFFTSTLVFSEPSGTPLSPKSLGEMQYSNTLKKILKNHTVYPRKSRLKAEQGIVECLIIVNKEGKVNEFELIKASKYSRLNLAAKYAVQKATFPKIPHNLDADTFEFRVALKFSL